MANNRVLSDKTAKDILLRALREGGVPEELWQGPVDASCVRVGNCL